MLTSLTRVSELIVAVADISTACQKRRDEYFDRAMALRETDVEGALRLIRTARDYGDLVKTLDTSVLNLADAQQSLATLPLSTVFTSDPSQRMCG